MLWYCLKVCTPRDQTRKDRETVSNVLIHPPTLAGIDCFLRRVWNTYRRHRSNLLLTRNLYFLCFMLIIFQRNVNRY